jgi:hypothetical protein
MTVYAGKKTFHLRCLALLVLLPRGQPSSLLPTGSLYAGRHGCGRAKCTMNLDEGVREIVWVCRCRLILHLLAEERGLGSLPFC